MTEYFWFCWLLPGWPHRSALSTTHRPRQNGRQFPDDISNVSYCIQIYTFRLTFHWSVFRWGPFNNIPTLVQIIAWCRLCDKSLFASMMVSLRTYVCVNRLQWVKCSQYSLYLSGLRSYSRSALPWRVFINAVGFTENCLNILSKKEHKTFSGSYCISQLSM